MTDPDLLRAVGGLLFGPQWQTPLARHLRVSARAVRYWAAGVNPVPSGVWGELRDLASARANEVAELICKHHGGSK